MKKNPQISNRQSAVSNGFTLIEIMLVVLIILIVMGVAMPMFSGTSGATRMRDAVRSTIRTARFARSMAILNQADCTLSFATNRITLTGPDGPLADKRIPESIQITDFENLAESRRDRRKKREESEGAKTVLFYASGMNDGFELTLLDDKDRSHTIICNPVTGKVTLEEE